jgi:hypothetical protein
MLRLLAIIPLLDWWINLKRNPWGVPSRHLKLALVEHTFLYSFLGYLLSSMVGIRVAILAFLFAAIFGIPLEINLARRGIRPWKWLEGKDYFFLSYLFLSSALNIFAYYLIGSIIAVHSGFHLLG